MAIKLLTREEEIELGKKVQEGLLADKKLEDFKNGEIDLDEEEIKLLKEKSKGRLEAREIFFERNQGSIHKIAKAQMRKVPSSITEEELFHEGVFGLYTAVDKFNPDMGNKFLTMAYYWISLSIARAFNNTHRMVRLPENRITDFTRISNIAKELNKDISDKEVKEKAKKELNLTDEYYESIISAAPAHASLDYKVSSNSDEDSATTLADIISTKETSESAEDLAISNVIFQETIIEPAMKLSKCEQEAISLSTGIAIPGCSMRTKKELKEKYNISDKEYQKINSQFIEAIKERIERKGYQYSDFIEYSK